MLTDRRSKFVAVALAYKGTPFIHQCRKPGIGLDCVGLLECAAITAGYPDQKAARVYSRQPKPELLEAELAKWCVRDDDAHDEVGCIYLMGVPAARTTPSHFALYVGDGLILHALENVSVQVSNRDRWEKLILSTWVLKEPDDG